MQRRTSESFKNKKKKESTSTMDALHSVFSCFCQSSTIHGTFFWAEDINSVSKLLWVFVVVAGISSAGWIINNSFEAWQDSPVITSVAQLSIEMIPFPSITICPLDTTSFGFVEELINENPHSNLKQGEILFDSLKVLREMDTFDSSNDCLYAVCEFESSSSQKCFQEQAFSKFIDDYQEDYELKIYERLKNFVKSLNLNVNNVTLTNSQVTSDADCLQYIRDFYFFQELENRLGNFDYKTLKPGTLLMWLYTNTPSHEQKENLYRKYIDKQHYPEAYASFFNVTQDISFPQLVSLLTNSGYDEESNLKNIKNLGDDFGFSERLMSSMKSSIHPPHIKEQDQFYNAKIRLTPSFPFCWYKDNLDEGMPYGPYNEKYCQSFQTTINEEGLCYTYNNIDLGQDSSKKDFPIRTVQGCGKSKGLRLIVDGHKLTKLLKPQKSSKGFRVYVTVNGVVTHKVPFTIDPEFWGEYNFHFHGIHIIRSSPKFKEFNKEKKLCFFPRDKKLDFFKSYTQDSCLLECKLKKVSLNCGCSPWYLNQTIYPVCDITGSDCYEKQLNDYQDDLIDRTECDCKNDCEGVHFFSSMSKFGFEDRFATDYSFHYDSASKTGRLANYLLDPENAILDPLTKTMNMIHRRQNSTEFAESRFVNDIAVLNFYFDTPIITQIRLEMKINIFDQISAIGGTLGLFTGVSLVTFVEVVYWGLRILFSLMTRGASESSSFFNDITPQDSNQVEKIRPYY